MNKEQFVYILKENEALKLKLQRVEQSTERLQTRYYDTETQLNNFKRKYDFLYSQFKELARQCFPRDFIDKEIGSSSEKETYDFLLNKIRTMEQETFDLNKENEAKIEELKSLAEELDRYKNAGFQQTATSQTETGENPETTSFVQRPETISASEHPHLGLISNISEPEWKVLEIIGKGKTLFTDIATKLGSSNNATKDLLEELKS